MPFRSYIFPGPLVNIFLKLHGDVLVRHEPKRGLKLMIRCNMCEVEMFTASIDSVHPGYLPVMLVNREKGLFATEYKSELLCYVCPECGHIELYAKDPKKLRGKMIGK